MENKIIPIVYLLTLLLVIFLRNKGEIKSSVINLPDHFLKLNSQLRKSALDLAWKFGYREISSLPISSTAMKIFSALLGLIAIISNSLGAFSAIFLLTRPSEYFENRSGVAGLIIIYTLAILLLIAFFRSIKKAKIASMKDKEQKEYNSILQKLGVQFVQENVTEWISSMDEQTRPVAVKESSTIPESTFFLSSQDFSLKASGMPSNKLGITYIFSNGYMSAVSNIIFDIKQTSYSYLDSDLPTFYVNQSQDWTIEEFHYKDVVEFNYKPKESTSTTVKSTETNYPIDGYLHLGLVNGAQKEYPTSKKDVSNFLTLAREKVRSSKS